MAGNGLFLPGRPVPDHRLPGMDDRVAADGRAFDLDFAAFNARSPFQFG